jgi:hypothetical protein
MRFDVAAVWQEQFEKIFGAPFAHFSKQWANARDAVARRMTPQQIAEAQRLASDEGKRFKSTKREVRIKHCSPIPVTPSVTK